MRGMTTEDAPVQAPAEHAAPDRIVTLRAIGIACALMPLLSLWVFQSELIWYSGHSTAISLFFHVTFTLLVIALVNLLVQKFWPSVALTSGEMMTIYVMLSVAGTLCSHDLIQIFLPMLTFPEYNANPNNRWDTLIMPFIPDWAIVRDRQAIVGLAVGNASLYSLRILNAWMKPLLFWSVFLLALMGALLFLNVFFRKAWTERERLSFPIIQIPMLITTNLSSLLKSKLFWIAFVLVGSLDILNGFNYLYPTVPQIPIVDAFQFRPYFVERPWNSIAGTTLSLYPFVIGLVYFLPTDLAFSCWFFFIFFRLEIVASSALGLQSIPGFPFPNEQAGGGYIALALFTLWLSRRHLRGVWRTILGKSDGADDSDEPIRYRTALFGFLLCYLILVLCGVQLGGSVKIMFLFFLIFFFYSIAIARMRAELGPPAHDLHHMGPDMLIHNALGTRELGEGNVGVFNMFFWFNRAYRAHFSAHSMEGFKIAQLMKSSARSMMFATVIALLVGLLSAYWGGLHALYVHGYSAKPAGDAFACEAWNRMAAWLSFPQEPRIGATLATVFGIVFALFLGFMRTRFSWWVFHPVGFATCTSWSMGKLWGCIFFGWLAKAIITRYGGSVAYRKAMPFFVGLVLGEFVVGSLWCIYGAIAGTTVYHFWG